MLPVRQLAWHARYIAKGNFDEQFPESQRSDSVGRLTNSFILMQRSLAKSVADIKRVNREQEQRNEELSQAYKLKMEANERKTAFIQSMFHQIRTPLNIIYGFTQVLGTNFHELSEEEVEDITSRMKESAEDINTLLNTLKFPEEK
jgi:sigma-B regulation protein RsbU (phosphoserine phosphatase)